MLLWGFEVEPVKRIIIHEDKCVGCLSCTTACMQAQRTGSLFDLPLYNNVLPPRNRIYQRGGKYFPVFCRHCDEPDCVAACMSGALVKNKETGLVDYDPQRCAACYMCVMQCRYGHPTPDPTKHYVTRCTFCADTKQQEPQCVKACPTGAIEVQEVEVCPTT